MANTWEGVRSVSRRNGGLLEIVATVVDNCASKPIRGGFSLRGDLIDLSYERGGPQYRVVDGKKVEVLAACNCVYKLTYEISNVPPGRIQARIQGTGLAGPGPDPRYKPAPQSTPDPQVLFVQAAELEASGNVSGAVRLYRRAARAGSGKAAKRLGEIFSRGLKDIPQDGNESIIWFNMARELGETIP
jgi:hypothetical protein